MPAMPTSGASMATSALWCKSIKTLDIRDTYRLPHCRGTECSILNRRAQGCEPKATALEPAGAGGSLPSTSPAEWTLSIFLSVTSARR